MGLLDFEQWQASFGCMTIVEAKYACDELWRLYQNYINSKLRELGIRR